MKKRNRIGETSIANNGQKMTIIAYKNNKNVDIKFEDGTVVNKRYSEFKKGIIRNPNFHLGETILANNGQKMTIVTYHNNDDIDVEFEDGTIIRNRTYSNFKAGRIKNPNFHLSYPKCISKRNKCKNERIGEKSINTKGQKMTIIAYRSGKDLDIQFEDGTIVKNKSYYSFKHGCILKKDKNFRIGETVVHKTGQKMKIIEYFRWDNITIEFEDGAIRKHINYFNFKKGYVEKPDINTSIINLIKKECVDVYSEIMCCNTYNDYIKYKEMNTSKNKILSETDWSFLKKCFK